MADAVTVFDPGARLTDNSTGAPLSGAVIRFYDAGTTNPKTVYADQDLTTALGTSVTTDSLGAPTSDGTTKTAVYVDDASYKVRIETSAGVLIEEKDNLKGAVVSGDAGDGGSVVSTRTVETKSLDYTVLEADEGKYFAGNCSGGDVVFTLPSAATVGNGWFISIGHAGSANQVIVETVSSQTLTSGVLSYAAAMTLALSGEEVTLVSDGGNWRVFGHIGPHIKQGQGIVTVADRLGAAPVGPADGAWYLSTGSATWGATSVVNHDLIQHTTGDAYIKITPPTDCGWVVYVQDEDLYYRFIGSAWVAESASDSVRGTVELATAAEMATATDTGRVPSVLTTKNHPGVAKCWAVITVSGGTPTLAASYNITSITDTDTGHLTITIADDFSSANWAAVMSALEASVSGGASRNFFVESQAAGSVALRYKDGGGYTDPTKWFFAGYGTLA